MVMSLKEVISSLWSNIKTYLGNNYLSKNGKAASATSADNGVDSSGSNWIRFKDGTQICWGTSINPVMFPKPFRGSPTILPAHSTFTHAYVLNTVTSLSSSTFTFESYQMVADKLVSTDTEYIATGKWK